MVDLGWGLTATQDELNYWQSSTGASWNVIYYAAAISKANNVPFDQNIVDIAYNAVINLQAADVPLPDPHGLVSPPPLAFDPYANSGIVTIPSTSQTEIDNAKQQMEAIYPGYLSYQGYNIYESPAQNIQDAINAAQVQAAVDAQAANQSVDPKVLSAEQELRQQQTQVIPISGSVSSKPLLTYSRIGIPSIVIILVAVLIITIVFKE
jgi:hypothetical protein